MRHQVGRAVVADLDAKGEQPRAGGHSGRLHLRVQVCSARGTAPIYGGPAPVYADSADVCGGGREVELEAVPDHFGNNLASTRTRFAMLGDAWTLHMEGAEGYFGRELSFWLSREPPQVALLFASATIMCADFFYNVL